MCYTPVLHIPEKLAAMVHSKHMPQHEQQPSFRLLKRPTTTCVSQKRRSSMFSSVRPRLATLYGLHNITHSSWQKCTSHQFSCKHTHQPPASPNGTQIYIIMWHILKTHTHTQPDPWFLVRERFLKINSHHMHIHSGSFIFFLLFFKIQKTQKWSSNC